MVPFMSLSEIFVIIGVLSSVIMTSINFVDVMLRRRRLEMIKQESRTKEIQDIVNYYLSQNLDTKVSSTVQHIVREYMTSQEFIAMMNNVLNNSDLSMKIDKLILIMCTNIPEVKKSSMCNPNEH